MELAWKLHPSSLEALAQESSCRRGDIQSHVLGDEPGGSPLTVGCTAARRGACEAFTRVGWDGEGPQSALPYPPYRPGHREAVTEGIGAGRRFSSSVMGH